MERKGCAEREVWKGFYEEFRLRRRDVCRLLSVPAPQSEWFSAAVLLGVGLLTVECRLGQVQESHGTGLKGILGLYNRKAC